MRKVLRKVIFLFFLCPSILSFPFSFLPYFLPPSLSLSSFSSSSVSSSEWWSLRVLIEMLHNAEVCGRDRETLSSDEFPLTTSQLLFFKRLQRKWISIYYEEIYSVFFFHWWEKHRQFMFISTRVLGLRYSIQGTEVTLLNSGATQ